MKTREELEKEIKELNEYIQTQEKDSQGVYDQVNRLLLWKSSLKVRINEACPNKDLVGKEGYVGDIFPDGVTVWCPAEDPKDSHFYRIPGEHLDVLKWDNEVFEAFTKKLNYKQVNGIWTYQG